jgi:hypothetical protein
MKSHVTFRVGFASVFLVTIQGCVGYNTTMFMTKSNAGLDFDGKPPTLEISIARKEAVISPSFEGGKTPPVMASFRPSTGTGSGFTSFFLGVGQTFAGGDAAMAMSMLYDKPTATDINAYNSSFGLTEAPAYRNQLRRLAGPGETRPLIFGTDTSLGLKAAWSGVGGAVPDTVKLGFNRKEFAWSALSATPAPGNGNGKDQAIPVNVKLPAFLATIDAKETIGTSNKVHVESLQYFATGDAATYLAMQKDVRAAMHARLDPNQKQFKSQFGAAAQNVLADTMFAVQTVLDRFAKGGDKTAIDLLDRLNHLEGLQLPSKIGNNENPEFSFDGGNPQNLLLSENEDGEQPLGTTLSDVQSYLSTLERSERALVSAKTARLSGKTINFAVPGGNAQAITDDIQRNLDAKSAQLTGRSDDLKKALASNRVLVAAYRYVDSMISPQ